MAKIRAKGLEMLKLMQFLMIDVLMKNRRAIFSHHDRQKEKDALKFIACPIDFNHFSYVI